MKYRYFDLTIESGIELPELHHGHSEDQPVVCVESSTMSLDDGSFDWQHVWVDDDDDIDIRAGAGELGTILHFPKFDDASFVVSDSRSSVLALAGECPELTTRHLLLDQVLPRVIGQSVEPVIHGAAVVGKDGKAMLLLGDSGTGKSTLMYALSEAYGLRALSDDCLLLRSSGNLYSVTGSYPGARLMPDACEYFGVDDEALPSFSDSSPKKRMDIASRDAGPVEVARIVLLDVDEQYSSPVLKPMNHADAAIDILRQRFLINPSEHTLSSGHLNFISKMVSGVDCRVLSYSHEFEQLREVASLVHSL